MLTKYINELLETALDYGIKELEFWGMTIAEIVREIQSKKRVEKIQAQERASFDYILANLIGRSIGRLYSSSNKYPDISEVYPSLFDSDDIKEKKQAKQAELSILRFKQFAQAHNNKFKGGA